MIGYEMLGSSPARVCTTFETSPVNTSSVDEK